MISDEKVIYSYAGEDKSESIEQGGLTAGNGEIIIKTTDFWWGEKLNSGFACFVYYFSSFFY
jgi:hypothetical protein